MNPFWVEPTSRRPLEHDRPWSVTDGSNRWPVVDGVPFLRVNRESLRLQTLERLDGGDPSGALALLLADQDDYARIAPPGHADLLGLIEAVRSGEVNLREAMIRLNYGPVADYFAYRWSSPTYLSGLALLDRMGPAGRAGEGGFVIEVACGIGHYLRDLAARGFAAVGVDVVFSKLWLARHFVVPAGVTLACGDVAKGWPVGVCPRGSVVFCHDAFYFLPDKSSVVGSMARSVGDRGQVLIGHAHNRDFDHGGVSGEPKTPEEYASLCPGAVLFDDAELARSAWRGDPLAAPGRSADDLAARRVEAVAMAWPVGEPSVEPGLGEPRASLAVPADGSKLRLNPILDAETEPMAPRWPSDRFRREYEAESPYLIGEPRPDPATLEAARSGAWTASSQPEIARLARRRILLDLPERW